MEGRQRLPDWRAGALVGLAAALGLLLFQIGEVTVSDGASVLAVTHSILHHGSLSVPAAVGTLGRGGHYYAKYGIGLSIVAIPLVALGDLVGAVMGHQAQFESFGASSTMPFIAGALAMVLWGIAIRLGASKRWAAVIAFGAVFGTYALPYGKDFFSEPLTALGLAIAIERLLADRYMAAGLGLAIAVTTRPEAIPLVALMSLVVWRGRGFRAALEFATPAALGVIVDVAYNVTRFGSLTATGYKGEGFTTPFLHGAGGLLFGTDKSLFLFAPIVVLLALAAVKLWRQGRFYVTLAGAIFGVFFVLSALWHSWEGGWSWGPRLILPAVLCAMPLLAVLSSKLERRAVVALLFLGFAVSASTLLVPTEAQQLDAHHANGPSATRQYELVPSVVRYSISHLRAKHTPGASRQYASLWQVNLGRELGNRGLLIGITGSAVLVLALIATLPRLKRALDGRPIDSRVVADGAPAFEIAS